MSTTVSATPAAVSEAEGERLRQLARGLESLRTFHRFVDYAAAERLARELAVRLRREMGDEALRHAAFAAIPRGGILVLGMLAYLLDLAPEQLGDTAESAERVVLVDDCALSGLRLRQSLGRFGPRTSVVVAHLLSTPALRRAVLAAEPRVEACVAAADLADRTQELRAQVRPDRFELLARRFGGDRRYWFGVPELVSFAWSEPARLFWNEATQRVEDGWRLTPPHRCLSSFGRLLRDLPEPEQGTAPRGAVSQGAVSQGAIPGDLPVPGWRSAASVVWGELDGVLWLVDVASGGVYSLVGGAALVWKCLVTGGDAARASAVVKDHLPAGEAAAEVVTLMAELSAAGLIEWGDG